MKKSCKNPGGSGDPGSMPEKRVKVTPEVSKSQACGSGDGVDLLGGFPSDCTSSSSGSRVCEKAYKGAKYNKEGKRRHSLGQHRKSAEMFEKAAHHDSVDGLFNLGLCFELGIGVEKDSSKAAVKYAQACEKKHKHAAFNLGIMNIRGYCECDPNEQEGMKYLEKAYSFGLRKAATELGVMAVHRQPPQWEVAADWFKKAANESDEDPLGVLFCGHIYSHGYGNTAKDAETAKILYERAYKSLLQLCEKKKQCEGWMIFALGLCYEHGWGTDRDLSKARDCYEKSELPEAKDKISHLLDTHTKRQNEDLEDLLKMSVFRSTADYDPAQLEGILEFRPQVEDEEESWGSYSGDCLNKSMTESSSESSVSGSGSSNMLSHDDGVVSSKVASHQLQVTQEDSFSVEFE